MLLASATTPQNVFVATTKILSSAGSVLSKPHKEFMLVSEGFLTSFSKLSPQSSDQGFPPSTPVPTKKHQSPPQVHIYLQRTKAKKTPTWSDQ